MVLTSNPDPKLSSGDKHSELVDIPLPNSTQEVAHQLIRLHQLSVKSLVILTEEFKLIGSSRPINPEAHNKLVQYLRPKIEGVNYISLSYNEGNYFIVSHDGFYFIFVI